MRCKGRGIPQRGSPEGYPLVELQKSPMAALECSTGDSGSEAPKICTDAAASMGTSPRKVHHFRCRSLYLHPHWYTPIKAAALLLGCLRGVIAWPV